MNNLISRSRSTECRVLILLLSAIPLVSARPPATGCPNPRSAPEVRWPTDRVTSGPADAEKNPLARFGISPGPGTVKQARPLTAPAGDSPMIAVLRIAQVVGEPDATSATVEGSGEAIVDLFRWDGCRFQLTRTVDAGVDSGGAVGEIELVDIPVEANWLWVVQHECGAHPPCSDDITGYGPQGDSSKLELSEEWQLQDLDGDGVKEIIEAGSDGLECHVCMPRESWEHFLRWNRGEHKFETVSFTDDVSSKNPQVISLNGLAGDELKHGSMCRAGDLIRNAEKLEPMNAALQWNVRLIESGLSHGVDDELMGNLEHRCYAEAMEILERNSADQLFSLSLNPYQLLDSNDAEEKLDPQMLAGRRAGFALHLPDAANGTTENDSKREHAIVQFFDGWGKFLTAPEDPAILPALERAANLDPGNNFFRKCIQAFKSRHIHPSKHPSTSGRPIPKDAAR